MYVGCKREINGITPFFSWCGDAKIPMHLIFTVPPGRGNFSETALARGSMRRAYYIVAKSNARHAPRWLTAARNVKEFLHISV